MPFVNPLARASRAFAMQRPPPLNALHVFVTAARHLSFTRAAAALCLTQGAVSRQIQSLEAHYGFLLFVRRAKGLALTPEGEQLLPVVADSLARIDEVSRRLTRERSDLALKVPTCVMRWILPKVMQFQAEHPDLHVQLTTAWRHDVDFATEPFDAAIVYGDAGGPGIHAVPLFDERLTPVCAPELLAARPLAAGADLARHTLLHPTRDHRDWRQWLAHAGIDGIDAARGPSFDTLDLATNAAMQGFGVAIGDLTLVAEDVAARRLARPFDAVLATGARYALVCPARNAAQPKLGLFGAWLAAHRD
ncbi:Glycine cleavage system transcriptional activator [Burkholderia glumae]|nr:Glycine cleavage system transcriptional activator [Burkholderia glumae]QTP36492.1 Glycine cleavage system transcriptional activator [Burkholderia glumae]